MLLEIKSEEEFKNVINENEIVIVNFYTKCFNECSKILQVFDAYSKVYTDIRFVKVDADRFEALSDSFNVEALPTFIIFESGKITNKRLTSNNQYALLEILKSVSKLGQCDKDFDHSNENIHEINSEDDFLKLCINAKMTSIVNFYAKSSKSCKNIESHIKDYAQRFTDVQFLRVDVENPNLTVLATRANVQAIPTFIIYDAGKMTDKRVISKKPEVFLDLIKNVSKLNLNVDLTKVYEIKNKEEFLNLIENKTSIVKFYTNFCYPCKKVEPFLEGYSQIFTDIQFLKINVDELEELAENVNLKVIPTFIVYELGKMTHVRMEGAKHEDLLDLIKSLSKVTFNGCLSIAENLSTNTDLYCSFSRHEAGSKVSHLDLISESDENHLNILKAEVQISSESSESVSLDDSDLLVNCKIGKELGNGSFGQVNICQDLKNGDLYAVKRVHFDRNSMDPRLKQVFKLKNNLDLQM